MRSARDPSREWTRRAMRAWETKRGSVTLGTWTEPEAYEGGPNVASHDDRA